MKNAIILCSGGLDSVVTAHYVKKTGNYENLTILFFNYGQKTLLSERNASKLCAKNIGSKFVEIDVDFLKNISGSLINKKGLVKKITRKDLKNTKKEGKNWYVPCRNTIFLTLALALAESDYVKKKIKQDIFVGFKCEGNEPFPDTTKAFVKKFNELSKISSECKSEVHSPLIEKDKEDIILLGMELGVKLENTFSCYIGKKSHCGECLACMLRKEGFNWSGVEDKTKYSMK